MKYAGFWIRFCAAIIDAMVFIPLGIVVAIVDPVNLFSGWTVFNWVVGWLYFALMESSGWQATVGKRLVGIRVTDLSGNRITFGRATARYFAKILSWITLYIGYFMIAVTEKKQGLHDMLAGTLVIYGNSCEFQAFDSAINNEPEADTERIYTEHIAGSKVVIAGFDTNGHVVRLTFGLNDPLLHSGGLLIGRDPKSCNLVVSDTSVSRVHARISIKDNDLYIEDLDSTNGTFLDGNKLRPLIPVLMKSTATLMLGDIDLSIGKY